MVGAVGFRAGNSTTNGKSITGWAEMSTPSYIKTMPDSGTLSFQNNSPGSATPAERPGPSLFCPHRLIAKVTPGLARCYNNALGVMGYGAG